MRRSTSDCRLGTPSRGPQEVSLDASPRRLPSLLMYPFKFGRLLQKPTRRSKSVDLGNRQPWPSPPHSRSFHLDSLVFSVCSDEDFQEMDLTSGTTVALRDGSHIIVPPNHTPSSVPSVTSTRSNDVACSVQILTVRWQSATLGLVLQNIQNRSIVKEVTDAVDLVANPQLAQLCPGDELVAINEASAILLGFDATVDRLRDVFKPATLQFRRILDVAPPASSSSPVKGMAAPTGRSNPSSIHSCDFDTTTLGSLPPSTTPFLQPYSSTTVSDFDVDEARARLGKTEFFPLSTSHNVFTMLRWSGEPLGIALQKHPTTGHMEIKFCTGDGLAASHGCLGVGDVLVSVAGVSMHAFGLATCLDFLQATQKPVSMLFRRHGTEPGHAPTAPPAPSITSSFSHVHHEFTVDWVVGGPHQGPRGLTLQHFYCNDGLVVVVRAAASSQQGIQVGDRLVLINGLAVDALRLDAVQAMLRSTSKLTFHRQTTPWTL